MTTTSSQNTSETNTGAAHISSTSNPVEEDVKRAKKAATEASRFSSDAQEAAQTSNQRASHYAAIAALAAASAASHASNAVALADTAPDADAKVSEAADSAEADRDEAKYAMVAAEGRLSDIVSPMPDPRAVEDTFPDDSRADEEPAPSAPSSSDVDRTPVEIGQLQDNLIAAIDALNHAYDQVKDIDAHVTLCPSKGLTADSTIAPEFDVKDPEFDVEDPELGVGLFKEYKYDEILELLDNPATAKYFVGYLIKEAKANSPELKSLNYNINATNLN